MATGEKSFSMAGMQTVKYDSKPLPPAEYSLKVRGDKAETQKKAEPGSIPYVKAWFEALDTGSNGGRNRIVFHSFWLSLKPGSDGAINPQRANQLLGLARAKGLAEPPFAELAESMQVPLVVKVTNAESEEIALLNPKVVVAWLKSLDGEVVKARTKVRNQKDRDPSTEIDYFVEGEPESFSSTGGGTIEETYPTDGEVEKAVEEAPFQAQQAKPQAKSNGNGVTKSTKAPMVKKSVPVATKRPVAHR